MAKKYNWDSGEAKEQLIRRLFPEYKLNKNSKWEKKLPFSLEITEKGREPVITPSKSRDFNTLELIENSLKRDINPVMNPEWGEELVLAVKNGEFQDLRSLEIFAVLE